MSERWLRCGADVVTPNGIQTVSTYELNGPLVWTEDEHGATHEWPASALRPLEPVSGREHACVVAERDRLRRELEALRDQAYADHKLLRTCWRDDGASEVADVHEGYADRIDAILRRD